MIEKITFWKSCQKYGISLWKCPTFLFIVMGATTISSMVGVYLLGEYYDNPELVIPIVLVVVFVTFVPGSIIVQSFEKVAESDLMKSEFVSIASHQLRSPLTALKWSLSFLLGDHAGELGEEQKRYLYLMRKNNEQMIMLVGDLLNVSRVDRGELVIKEKKIKIGDLVEERIEELRPMAESRNVELKLKNNTSEYVMGDEIYLGMVINNFTDNAIKYARDKNAKVVVHIFNKDNNVRYGAGSLYSQSGSRKTWGTNRIQVERRRGDNVLV